MEAMLTRNADLSGADFAYRTPAAGLHLCGACGETFTDPADVYAHLCTGAALPRLIVDPIGGPFTIRPATGRAEAADLPVASIIAGDPAQAAPRPAAASSEPAAEATPAAEVEAWLAGLGRKVEPADVTDGLRRAAARWALDYTGDFAFMLDMHAAAKRGRFSVMQAKGTLNCWRADMLRRQPAAAPAATAPVAPAGPAVKVPEGRYAYTAAEGTEEEHTAFCKVEHGKGAWAGRVFVRLLVGAPGHFAEMRTSAATAASILRQISADPRAAAVRFGHEVGQCGRCGSPLTDPDSIARGIGPTCASKAGW